MDWFLYNDNNGLKWDKMGIPNKKENPLKIFVKEFILIKVGKNP